MQLWDIELWCYLIGITVSQFISLVSVDDLHVLQETIIGILTQQAFHSWVAINFNASGLMDNTLVCFK